MKSVRQVKDAQMQLKLHQNDAVKLATLQK